MNCKKTGKICKLLNRPRMKNIISVFFITTMAHGMHNFVLIILFYLVLVEGLLVELRGCSLTTESTSSLTIINAVRLRFESYDSD